MLLFIFCNKSYINELKQITKYNNQFYNTYYLKMPSNALRLYYQFLKQIRQIFKFTNIFFQNLLKNLYLDLEKAKV